MGLPTELLVIIFKICLSSNDDRHAGLDIALPARLMRVCKTWKYIAVSIPALWDVVCPTRQIRSSESDRDAIRGISAWASRAGTRPVSLGINFRPGAFLLHQPGLSVPWSRLVHLVLLDQSLTMTHARNILFQSTNLVTCAFTMDGHIFFNGDMIPDMNPFTLPLLTSLSITFHSAFFMKDLKLCHITKIHPLFQPLVLPALEELEIIATHSCVEYALLPALVSLHQRSSFALNRLHIAEILFNIDALHNFLLALPTLTELHLQSQEMYHDFFRLVELLEYEPAKGSANILPRLEVLTIIDCIFPNHWGWVDEAVLDVLESRWWNNDQHGLREFGVTRLRNVTIKWGALDGGRATLSVSGRGRAARLQREGRCLSYPTLRVDAI
jgi:hypothetical protein